MSYGNEFVFLSVLQMGTDYCHVGLKSRGLNGSLQYQVVRLMGVVTLESGTLVGAFSMAC